MLKDLNKPTIDGGNDDSISFSFIGGFIDAELCALVPTGILF